MADPFSFIKHKIETNSWLQKRDYRGDKNSVLADYWRILAFTLLCSKIQTPKQEHMSQQAFQAVLMKSFNPVFINIEGTKENILDILRGFPRLGIDKDPELVNDFLFQHQSTIESNTAYIYNSIIAGGGGKNIIRPENPEIIDLRKYDHWHTRLKQPFSLAFQNHYPPQLFVQDDDDGTKIVLNVQILPNVIQTWQSQTELAARSNFILFAFEHMLEFFTAHPDQPTFSEDRII